MFHFPDSARDLYPGVFRAHALRAVYVDGKGGGQVNYLKELAVEWWSRWSALMENGYHPAPAASYASTGIDYIVLKAANRMGTEAPAYENGRYVVYKTHP